MPLHIPRGIDPSETWELDYALAEGRTRLAKLRSSVERQRALVGGVDDPEKRKELEDVLARAEAAATALEADLKSYAPGSGPVFVIGHIPNGKRAELNGEFDEVDAMRRGRDFRVRDRRWAENVVRWSVKGHRNVVSVTGKPILFATEEAEFDGRKVQVVARETLEAYGAFNLLTALPHLILVGQGLDEAGKNV